MTQVFISNNHLSPEAYGLLKKSEQIPNVCSMLNIRQLGRRKEEYF